MRRQRYVLMALALGFAALAPTASRAEGQRGKERAVELPVGARIAVVASNSRGGSQVDTVVAEMLMTTLRRNGWRVLERQELDSVLREQQLVRSGDVDPATAVAAGKLTGAQYIVSAKATEFGVRDNRTGALFGLGPFGGLQVRTATGRVVLDARVVDVATGEVLGAATGEGKVVNYGGSLVGGSWLGDSISVGGVDVNSKEWSESLLGRAARKAVDQVLERLLDATPVTAGRVLAATDDGIYVISLGRNDGVREGDELAVLQVESIRDKAGQPVWSEEVRIGTLRVTEVKPDRSKAQLVDGKKPEEGYLVRLLRGDSDKGKPRK